MPKEASARAVDAPKDTVVIDLDSPNDAQAVILSFISQDAINAMRKMAEKQQKFQKRIRTESKFPQKKRLRIPMNP